MARLVEQVSSPALHRQLLGGFSGPYSLGVGKDTDAKPVLVLSVPSTTEQSFPAQVMVGGESVSVEIHRNFKAPVPLAATMRHTSPF